MHKKIKWLTATCVQAQTANSLACEYRRLTSFRYSVVQSTLKAVSPIQSLPASKKLTLQCGESRPSETTTPSANPNVLVVR